MGKKVVNQTGWWEAHFSIRVLDHTKDKAEWVEDVRFQDLSEGTQQHILELIADGCFQGEIVEDYEIEDENIEEGEQENEDEGIERTAQCPCASCGNGCATCER